MTMWDDSTTNTGSLVRSSSQVAPGVRHVHIEVPPLKHDDGIWLSNRRYENIKRLKETASQDSRLVIVSAGLQTLARAIDVWLERNSGEPGYWSLKHVL
jgi:hypothetical protein